MNTVMDILTLPIVVLWRGLAVLFGGWWIWPLWAAAVICLGASREMRPVWAGLGDLTDRARRAGSNALRAMRRKDRS